MSSNDIETKMEIDETEEDDNIRKKCAKKMKRKDFVENSNNFIKQESINSGRIYSVI